MADLQSISVMGLLGLEGKKSLMRHKSLLCMEALANLTPIEGGVREVEVTNMPRHPNHLQDGASESRNEQSSMSMDDLQNFVTGHYTESHITGLGEEGKPKGVPHDLARHALSLHYDRRGRLSPEDLDGLKGLARNWGFNGK